MMFECERPKMYDDFQYKMIIAIPKEIKLTKGLMAVHVSHVAVKTVEEAKKKNLKWVRSWFSEGQKKVTVQVPTIEELTALFYKAQNLGLPCTMVKESKKGNLPEGTITAIGIGPAPNSKVSPITSDLKLL